MTAQQNPGIAIPWIENDADEYNQFDPECQRFYPVRDPEGAFSAVIRNDGCVDLTRHYDNDDSEYKDLIHICDLDDFIARLQALKVMAETHYGVWPD